MTGGSRPASRPSTNRSTARSPTQTNNRTNLASVANRSYRSHASLYLENKALDHEAKKLSKALKISFSKAYDIVYYDIYKKKNSTARG